MDHSPPSPCPILLPSFFPSLLHVLIPQELSDKLSSCLLSRVCFLKKLHFLACFLATHYIVVILSLIPYHLLMSCTPISLYLVYLQLKHPLFNLSKRQTTDRSYAGLKVSKPMIIQLLMIQNFQLKA